MVENTKNSEETLVDNQKCIYEVSCSTQIRDNPYILSIKKYPKKFEISVEDELNCYIFSKTFNSQYITKLNERMSTNLTLDSVSNFINQLFCSKDVLKSVDIMINEEAKSLVENSRNNLKASLNNTIIDPSNDDTKNNTESTPECKKIIFIVRYSEGKDCYVLPFPQSLKENLDQIYYRNMIKKLRAQINKYESNITSKNCKAEFNEKNDTKSLGNVRNIEAEPKSNKNIDKTKTEIKSVAGSIDLKANSLNLGNTENSEIQAQQTFVAISDQKNDNIGLKEQQQSLVTVNQKQKKFSGAVEFDNLIGQKNKLNNDVNILTKRISQIENTNFNIPDLKNNFNRKEHQLKIIKEQVKLAFADNGNLNQSVMVDVNRANSVNQRYNRNDSSADKRSVNSRRSLNRYSNLPNIQQNKDAARMNQRITALNNRNPSRSGLQSRQSTKSNSSLNKESFARNNQVYNKQRLNTHSTPRTNEKYQYSSKSRFQTDPNQTPLTSDRLQQKSLIKNS